MVRNFSPLSILQLSAVLCKGWLAGFVFPECCSWLGLLFTWMYGSPASGLAICDHMYEPSFLLEVVAEFQLDAEGSRRYILQCRTAGPIAICRIDAWLT